MKGENRGQIVLGIILILVGLGFFVERYLSELSGAWFLLVLGAGFLAGYFYTRGYGLLIPGCILVGLGIGEFGGEAGLAGFRDFGAIGLGLGFIAIYAIDRAYRGGDTPWWPLIPGGFILLGGLASASESLARSLELAWPLLLIFGGLWLLARTLRLGPHNNTTPEARTGDDQAPEAD